MIQLNPEKLAKLKRADKWFDERYGKSDTQPRKDFENKALTWYYAEILREARKKGKITQSELAEKIGKKREYVSLLEKGETDMQLSTFLNISQALGLNFVLV
jgi:ribosome-binding protein aMBF1 (putative translation factor)